MEIYSDEMKAYFESLQREIDRAYEIAREARAQGKDPNLEVEVPQATDMAGRVESLVGPKGVAERIRVLVKEYGKELAALKVVDEIIDGRFGKIGDKEKTAEQAVRTALAILTEGIVSAPLEGIADVKIKRNTWADNSEYLALYYAGPIRSSGGTAQALSVLVGDYVRKKLGLDRFKPSEKHIERMVEEVDLYHRAVTRLQYHPEADEVRLAMRNIPIEITGEETDKVEVSHRDVEGVETNHIRGGAILVMAEGVLQKAKKLVKYIDKMGIEGWGWIKEFVEAKEKGKKAEGPAPSGSEAEDSGAKEEVVEMVEKGFYYELYEKFRANIAPNKKYTKEIIGGRPLFAEPSTNGGFRLRYGRSRVSGFATWSVNPATMLILDEFIAVGTQMKTERPGKGCIVTPATTIEGPVVKLRDGSVVRVDDYETALRVRDELDEILYVGDALVNFGDFVENNQTLLPANYAEEWWIQEMIAAVEETYEVHLRPFSENPREAVEEAAEYLEIDPDFLDRLLKDPLRVRPTVEEAVHLSKVLDIPFHPHYTLYWNTLTPEEVEVLVRSLAGAQIEWDEFKKNRFARKVLLNHDGGIKRYLELLGLPHRLERIDGEELIVVEYPWSAALLTPLGNLEREFRAKPFHTVIDIINGGKGIKLRDRGVSWIGARMGRPEKAKERKMKPPVHVLFPIGLAGGSTRDIKKAAEAGRQTSVEIAWFRCPDCGSEGPTPLCPQCGTRRELLYHCPKCNVDYPEDQARDLGFRCPKCGMELKPFSRRRINPSEIMREAMERVHVNTLDKLKGVMGMTSGYKMAEPLEKGLLRAKNDVYVFKDGTIRFDATDAPITHFKPKEIGTSVEKLRELGYTHDFEGRPLERDDQILELRVQDVILPYEAGRYLLKVANFIDDLLEKFYGLPRFYNAETMEDLVGHLVIGLAPHTSAGIIGRIIGFSDVLVGYAHPYYHAAKRRNCFPGDTRILVQIDGKPARITLRELYELFEEESYENMVYVRKRPKKDVKAYSFDPESGKVVLTDIEDVIKAPSTDHLIRFELELGRGFETTVDHPVLVYENGKFVEKRAFEVKEGDRILVPKLEFEEGGIEHFDLLKAFSDERFAEVWDIIMVRGLSEWLSSLGVEVNGDYLRRDSLPLKELLRIMEDNGLSFEDVPDCWLAFKRDKVRIQRFAPIKPLMRVLGYYLSEGYARKSDSVYQISFSIADEEVREDLKKALREAFGDGFGIYERGEKMTVGSRILYLLFTEVFSVGKNAHTKRVPHLVYTLPKDVVAEMLRAYFEGDGTIIGTKPMVVVYSVNRPLLEDIDTLLISKFGLYSSWGVDRDANSRPGNVVQKYHQVKGGTVPVSKVYRLNLYGIQALNFMGSIGFISKRKNSVAERWRDYNFQPYRRATDMGVLLKVRSVEFIQPPDDVVYSLSASKYHTIIISNNITTANCDGDEDAVMLLMDALLNFSKYYLPEKRGGKMDAPLVVTTRLDPREVDSEVHNMDVVRYYPLEFYEATYEMKSPKGVKVIERVEDRLGKPEMYEGLKFTHDTDDIGLGPKMSLYKQLGDMVEKVERQLGLAERIRAVDENHVAETIINSHIIPDLRGNLRSFTRQEFRCVKCNTKYRRPPLGGKCPRCGGKIVLTVSKGAIEKYLPTAKMIVTKYDVLDYTRQRICITEKDIKTLFDNVFPERQRTLMSLRRDICDKMVAERTGKARAGNGYFEELKANGKFKKRKEKGQEPKKSEGTKASTLGKAIKDEKSRMKRKRKSPRLDEFFG